MVIDGTGAPPFPADVGVLHGRIEDVAAPGQLDAARAIDASRLAVAPGFIDLDSHVDWAVAREGSGRALARWLRQGVTTVIGGACGFSPAPILPGGAEVVGRLAGFLCDGPFDPPWRSFREFLDVVAAAGTPLNLGFLIGQNTLRAQAVGSTRTASAAAADVMLEQTREALRAGALGLSVNAGFVPGVFASDAELASLAEVVAREDGLLAAHARAYTWIAPAFGTSLPRPAHNVRSILELVDLARRTGARLHVLHLMLAGRRTWRTCRDVLRCFEAAEDEGLDVGFDAAPYPVAVGPLQLLFPPWFVADFAETGRSRRLAALRLLGLLQPYLLGIRPEDVRLRCAGGDPSLAEQEGRSFAEIGRRLRLGAVDAEVEVARRVGTGGASVLLGTASGDGGDESALRAILSHRLCTIGTNAASTRTGPQNPSVTGAFPRVLGRYARDLGLMSLEEAVRRMTSLPAARLGLTGMGRVAAGYRADLTLFDPDRIGDPAEPERPEALPVGVRAVLVSGVPVVEDGVVHEGVLPGRVLRRPGG